MPAPSKNIKVYVRSDATAPGASDEIDGIDDATYNELVALAETTDFKASSASGWKTRIATIGDSNISLSGQMEAADAPQQLLRSSKRSGATVYLTIHWDPSASAGYKGVRVPMLVESYEVKDSGVEGVSEYSTSLQGNGAPTDV